MILNIYRLFTPDSCICLKQNATEVLINKTPESLTHILGNRLYDKKLI
jgi:hypothetical protein